jgi:hypothetical protein
LALSESSDRAERQRVAVAVEMKKGSQFIAGRESEQNDVRK